MTSSLHRLIFITIQFSVILEDLKLKMFSHVSKYEWMEETWSHRLSVVLSDGNYHMQRIFSLIPQNGYGTMPVDRAKKLALFPSWWQQLRHAMSMTLANPLSGERRRKIRFKRRGVLYSLHEDLFEEIYCHTQPSTYLFLRFCMNFSSVISSKRTKSNTPTSCSRSAMVAIRMYVAEGYELFQC